MPAYPWMETNEVDLSSTPAKIRVLKKLGTPYPENYDEVANEDYMEQAEEVVAELEEQLKEQEIKVNPKSEMVALIAYLQRLGTDIKKTPMADDEE
jgi:cytochrome c oxidase cbb3-type subunit I/II